MNLKNNFISILQEALEQGIFEVIVILDTDRKQNLTDVLTVSYTHLTLPTILRV